MHGPVAPHNIFIRPVNILGWHKKKKYILILLWVWTIRFVRLKVDLSTNSPISVCELNDIMRVWTFLLLKIVSRLTWTKLWVQREHGSANVRPV